MISHTRAHPRTTVAGVVILVLGIWGALVPFVGPTFGYDMGGSPAFTWTESHLTLHLLPGIAAVVGAVLLLRGRRATATSGALLAAAGGVWFVVAPTLHPLWAGQSTGGMSMGGSALSSALSGLGYHYGTGVLIAVAAAYAWGVLAHARDRAVDGPRVHAPVGRQGTSDSARVRVDA